MAGKYAEVAKQYPRLEPRDGDFQTTVNALKRKVTNRKPANLAAAYSRLRKQKAALEEKVTAHNAKLAAVEQLMWSAFEHDNLESLALKDGQRVGVVDDISVSLADAPAFYAWVKKNELTSLMTIHSGTISTITKERILAGSAAPDGVSIGSFKKTTFVKG